MRTWAPTVAALVTLVAAPPLFAQGQSGVEIAPFVGYRFGGSVGDTYSAGRYGIDAARSEGVTISVPSGSRTAVEFLFSRQDTSVDVAAYPATQRHALRIEHWMVGAVGELRGRSTRVRPFTSVYLGLTRIRSGEGSTTSRGYASAAIGGGVKFDLARHVGARFAARAYAVFVRSGAGAICGPAGCSLALTGNAMFQGEVAASLVLKL